jgi:WD40 repeat protein
VLTGGLDPVVSWWNAQTGERTKRSPGHGVAISEIAVGPKADVAATAGADKTVRLWNTKAMEALRTIPVGTVVYAVALRSDGKVVAAGGFDGLVRLYDTEAGRPLVTLVGVTEGDWLAITQEGFAVAGESAMKVAHWRSGKVDVNADWIWKAVRQPATVARALNGEKVGEPAFAVPQP